MARSFTYKDCLDRLLPISTSARSIAMGDKQLYTLQYVPVSTEFSESSPQPPQTPGQVVMHERRFEQARDAAPAVQTMRPTTTVEMPELEPLPAAHRGSRHRKQKPKSKSLFRSGVEWWNDDLSHDERKCIVYAGCCVVCCGGVPICPSPCACASPCGNNCCGCQACTDCLPVDCFQDLTRCATGDCFAQCDTCKSCGSCSIM